jgi:ribosome-associated toxin RatA of RatAB toxin-antitoxin module
MTFNQSIVIDADPAALFRLTQDYDRRLEWDPFLRSARLIGDASEPGVGVRALCVAKNGWAMETEYASFIPPRLTAVKMTRGPWFLERFAGAWHFEEIAPGQTRVDFRYGLRVWPSWLSWLLTPIVSRVFAQDTRNRLRALKETVEQQRLSSKAGADD